MAVAQDTSTTPDGTLDATFYFLRDAQYNVTALTDSNGAVIERYEYGPFGQPTILNAAGAKIESSAYGNALLFTGREYDAETGLYNYRHRMYDPKLGRFISPEPYGDWYDANNLGNGFAYVGNSPWMAVDPLGLEQTWGEWILYWLDVPDGEGMSQDPITTGRPDVVNLITDSDYDGSTGMNDNLGGDLGSGLNDFADNQGDYYGGLGGGAAASMLPGPDPKPGWFKKCRNWFGSFFKKGSNNADEVVECATTPKIGNPKPGKTPDGPRGPRGPAPRGPGYGPPPDFPWIDGDSASTNDVLDSASDLLGDGWTETSPGSGVFQNADGTFQFRITSNSELSGPNPHANFEWGSSPRGRKPNGNWLFEADTNIHVNLPEER